MPERKQESASGVKLVCKNRRAIHDYFISDRIEAGLVLLGSEVKSLRDGRASLGDAYAEVRGGEAYLVRCHIAEYPWANQFNHEPLRERKLLLHRSELRRLAVKLNERGFTLVPLALYFKHGRVKVELGLAKGKRLYDKREALRRRDLDRAEEASARRQAPKNPTTRSTQK
jgi:SsrA-binding protein